MLGHTSLAIYYKTMFSMVQFHKYSLAELESLIPYEMEIYVQMLAEYVQSLEDNNK